MMFIVSLVVGSVFAVFWSVYKKDVQGSVGIVAYVTIGRHELADAGCVKG